MRGLARDSAYLFAAQVVVFLLGMVSSIVLSRTLGPTFRGVYFMVLTVSLLVSNLGSLGMGFTNLYLLAKGKAAVRQVNLNSLLMACLLGLGFLLLYLLLRGPLHAGILREVEPKYVLLGMSVIPLTLYQGFWGGIASGLKKFALTSRLEMIVTVLTTAALLLVLLVGKWGLAGVLGVWAGGIVLFTLVRVALALSWDRLRPTLSWPLLKESLAFGGRGHLGNIAFYIYSRLDIWAVNYYAGVTGVGLYSLAVSLAERTWFLPTPIINAANPRIGEAKREEAGPYTALIIRHTLLLGMGTALAILVVSPWAIPLLYGEEFRPSVAPLLILLPGAILILVSMTISNYFTFQLGRPEIPAIMAWATLAVNAPLMIGLTSRYGFNGAAAATTLTYLFRFTLAVLWFFRASGQRGTVLLPRPTDLLPYLSLARSLWARRGLLRTLGGLRG